jgi:hypothetical protein
MTARPKRVILCWRARGGRTVPEPTFLTQLERRAESALDAAQDHPLVRLVREDAVGRGATIAAVAFAWIALALLEIPVALAALACASVAWLRVKRLPPAREPDPDDWL